MRRITPPCGPAVRVGGLAKSRKGPTTVGLFHRCFTSEAELVGDGGEGVAREVSTRSARGQHKVSTRSAQGQHTAGTRSAHGQRIASARSAQGQRMASAPSAHGHRTVSARSAHGCAARGQRLLARTRTLSVTAARALSVSLNEYGVPAWPDTASGGSAWLSRHHCT